MKTAHRNRRIVALCAGQRVLDLGCVGEDKLDKHRFRGHWLHEQIREQAKSAIGVDRPGPALEQLRTEGYDVREGDLERLEALTDPGPVDVVVAADCIEHLSCPGRFLDGAQRFFGPDTRLVLTTPNAFYFRNFLYTWQRRERVHPDHVCWYSQRTLRQLLERHGYRVEDDTLSLLDPAEFPVSSPRNALRRVLYLRTLRFSKTLIAVARSARPGRV